MTNKEAQLTLANLKRYISGGGAVDRGTNNAIDMAIEALSKPEIVMYNDCISRQQAINALSTITMYKGSIPFNTAVMRIEQLPPAQPERTCVNCGRTVNNGGWYADGRTRCPIEEHYALPKDGYCHLWEKRNVTDDDYPERREE